MTDIGNPAICGGPALEAGSQPAVQGRHWRALPAILLGSLLAQFDLFVVNVAAPSVQAGLHATTGLLQLAVGGYSLTYGTLLMAGGRFGDVLGARSLLRAGMVAFAIASGVCALSQTGPELVAARVAQGACAAVMVPQVARSGYQAVHARRTRQGHSLVRGDPRPRRGPRAGARRVPGHSRPLGTVLAHDIPRRPPGRPARRLAHRSERARRTIPGQDRPSRGRSRRPSGFVGQSAADLRRRNLGAWQQLALVGVAARRSRRPRNDCDGTLGEPAGSTRTASGD